MSLKKQIVYKLETIITKIAILITPDFLKAKNKFPKENYGIISRIENSSPKSNFSNRNEFIPQLIKVFGIQVQYPFNLNMKVEKINRIKSFRATIDRKKTIYDESSFKSYDGLEIPLYVFYPPNFDKNKQYPTLIIFSGHGSAKQAVFEKSSYQHGCGVTLSQLGFLVYVMENRGMGKLFYLGDHLRIDAVARITGGSWYGEIITDALWLVEVLQKEPNVDITRVSTAGVSTGGFLSMIIAALDERIASAYVQGFLSSFKTAFGARGNHCLCGHISGIINICDMSDIASLIAPRPSLFVNGGSDRFYYTDAMEEFKKIYVYYKKLGKENNTKFLAPKGVLHEFSVEIAKNWFSKLFELK